MEMPDGWVEIVSGGYEFILEEKEKEGLLWLGWDDCTVQYPDITVLLVFLLLLLYRVLISRRFRLTRTSNGRGSVALGRSYVSCASKVSVPVLTTLPRQTRSLDALRSDLRFAGLDWVGLGWLEMSLECVVLRERDPCRMRS